MTIADSSLTNSFLSTSDAFFFAILMLSPIRSPLHPAQLLTKRIIALPGDVIRVPTPNSTSTSATSTGRQNFTRIKIPPGHAWVEGDSSLAERTVVGKSARSEADKSRDSREFGPVSEQMRDETLVSLKNATSFQTMLS